MKKFASLSKHKIHKRIFDEHLLCIKYKSPDQESFEIYEKYIHNVSISLGHFERTLKCLDFSLKNIKTSIRLHSYEKFEYFYMNYCIWLLVVRERLLQIINVLFMINLDTDKVRIEKLREKKIFAVEKKLNELLNDLDSLLKDLGYTDKRNTVVHRHHFIEDAIKEIILGLYVYKNFPIAEEYKLPYRNKAITEMKGIYANLEKDVPVFIKTFKELLTEIGKSYRDFKKKKFKITYSLETIE